jgi:hypothetical protein
MEIEIKRGQPYSSLNLPDGSYFLFFSWGDFFPIEIIGNAVYTGNRKSNAQHIAANDYTIRGSHE